jgi:type I restriction enzyme, S subunit
VDILYKIPDSWVWTTLEQIADMTSGGTPSRTKKEYWNGNINWLKSGELKDTYIHEVEEKITEDGLKGSSAKIFPKDTLLMAMYGATVGRLGILNVDSSTNQAVCAIFNHHKLFVNEYLFFYLLSMRQKMLKDSFGGAQPNLSQGYIKSIDIPFAPLNEQKRIVAKIEKLFSNLDNSDKYLLHLEKQLKRYRQSVLKSAFEGELTKEWREKQTNLETADELLGKIKIERTLYVENEIREKFKDKTEKWIKDKVKKEVEKFYSELKHIDKNEIPFEIPRKWKWSRFDELSKKITDGTHFSPTNTDKGDYKYITAKNIKYDGIKLNNLTFVTKEIHKEIYSRCNPEFGDILLIKDGATTGVCTLNTLTEEFSMLSSVALIKNFKNIKNRYILKYLRSSVLYSFIRNDMKGVGITRITLAQLKNFIFPICSLQEQIKVVEEIEKHFSIIDKLETVVQQSIKESKRLRQSILKQAFEGKLVEQDSNDESASLLLEKIAKAKEEYQKAQKKQVRKK